MAIFIPGMRCAISGRSIEAASDAVVFPPFVANEADPIYVFNDAVVHADEFRAHYLSADAQTRLEEARRRTAPDNRRCFVCGRPILEPEDYIGVGHLVSDQSHSLFGFNYAHFHRSCLAAWRGLPGLVADLEKLDQSGAWKGDGLKRIISSVRPALGRSEPLFGGSN